MSNKMNDIFTEHLPELIAHSGDRKELSKRVRKLIKDSGGVRAITNPDSIIRSLTKTILEAMLEEELEEHLGYEKHGNSLDGNVRNCSSPKKVKSPYLYTSEVWRY